MFGLGDRRERAICPTLRDMAEDWTISELADAAGVGFHRCQRFVSDWCQRGLIHKTGDARTSRGADILYGLYPAGQMKLQTILGERAAPATRPVES